MEKVLGILGAIIFVGLLSWGGTDLFADDSAESSNTISSYRSNLFDAEYENTYSESTAEDYSTDESVDTFHGYDCTDDCSGHEAGYQWAEDNGITDEYDCDGNSNSFNEGCQAYVKETQ